MSVHSEHGDQDARRYQSLSAYLLLTALMRRVRMTVSPGASDALLYRTLKNHVLSNGIMRHMELPAGETRSADAGRRATGCHRRTIHPQPDDLRPAPPSTEGPHLPAAQDAPLLSNAVWLEDRPLVHSTRSTRIPRKRFAQL